MNSSQHHSSQERILQLHLALLHVLLLLVVELVPRLVQTLYLVVAANAVCARPPTSLCYAFERPLLGCSVDGRPRVSHLMRARIDA